MHVESDLEKIKGPYLLLFVFFVLFAGLATWSFKQFQQHSENSFRAELRNKIHYGFVSFNEHTLYLSGN
jgi:hypothetical protein